MHCAWTFSFLSFPLPSDHSQYTKQNHISYIYKFSNSNDKFFTVNVWCECKCVCLWFHLFICTQCVSLFMITCTTFSFLLCILNARKYTNIHPFYVQYRMRHRICIDLKFFRFKFIHHHHHRKWYRWTKILFNEMTHNKMAHAHAHALKSTIQRRRHWRRWHEIYGIFVPWIVCECEHQSNRQCKTF